MENTRENALRFFAAHLNDEAGCRAALFHPSRSAENREGKLIMSASILADIHEGTFSHTDFYIKAKSLSSISEQDAEGVSKIASSWDDECPLDAIDVEEWIDEIMTGNCALTADYVNGYQIMEIVDYLGSKGYLVGFGKLSAEEIIAYGWARTNTN